ncbi:metal-dependent hydrolase [Methylomarinum vadi]|uniref:metal-dependent hydrolase n=1 Tax=Methylomarinum vadi TaxID=438855 RepID=UPI000A04D96D|nr:metal-dependent hydrolase [Methylomarinum vadi]
MANFNTHVTVASAASGLAASTAAYVGLIEAMDAAWYMFIGVIGGMLPDIDADNSTPVKRLFTFLAGLCGVSVWTIFAPFLESQRLLLAAAVGFLLVRYPLFFLFQQTTVHRGVFHSLLGALFFGLLAVCVNHYFLHWTVLQSWLSGIFLVFGFIVHLCLDEVFSVDLANGRMKKSFGTALKLFSYNDATASSLLLVAAIALYIAAPPASQLIRAWEMAQWAKVDITNGQSFDVLERSGLDLLSEFNVNPGSYRR